MRRFGISPSSCGIFFPEGAKYQARERSKNEHMTCTTLIEKKLVEQDGKYEKAVGGSHTKYRLSELGKKVLKEIKRQEAK
jgi:predicted RNA binding protein YcfA (HicA-like mRNA interferase family)